MRATAREGAPLGIMYVIETAAVGVATLMIGAFGTVALAGNQVAQSVGGLLYMLPLGVAGAVAIRVAQERGAGNVAALRPIAYAALAVAMIWLVGAALVLATQGAAIARLVTDDPAVVSVAAAIFLAFAPMQISDGCNLRCSGPCVGCRIRCGPPPYRPSAIGWCPCRWAMSLRITLALARRASGRGSSWRWPGQGRR